MKTRWVRVIKTSLDSPWRSVIWGMSLYGIIKSVVIFGKNHLKNSCNQTVVVNKGSACRCFYVRKISFSKFQLLWQTDKWNKENKWCFEKAWLIVWFLFFLFFPLFIKWIASVLSANKDTRVGCVICWGQICLPVSWNELSYCIDSHQVCGRVLS